MPCGTEIAYPLCFTYQGGAGAGNKILQKNFEGGLACLWIIHKQQRRLSVGTAFATLEKIQEEASPGINATIRDRFYGSASATPVAAFPHLMKLKNHHLSKLENRGRAVNLERMIGEIMDALSDFPAHLSQPDQGRFAVGYYHQRQAFFTSSKKIQQSKKKG